MAYNNTKTEHAFQTFHKDLKNGIFPEVIFMYGEEEYLIQWAVNSLANKFVDKGMRDIDYVKVNENEEIDELLAMCDTFSMISERRIIWAKDYAPLLKKNSKGFGEKELEKLICYTMNKKAIEAADVEAVTTEQISSKIYELVNIISSHNQKQALDMFYDLLSQKEKPSRILYSLTKHFDTLLAIKIMSSQGFHTREMEDRTGLKDWMIRKYQGQTRAFSIETLKKAVQDGVEYETAIKTGHIEEQLAVELFIIEYSKK